MADINIKVTNNCPAIMAALQNAAQRGLLACGEIAEGYAKDDCPVDTGNLRNNITHGMANENTVEIGTNVEYGVYVECGTGSYSTVGGGTPKEQWIYKGDDGEFHLAHPMQARPYLKPAVADHTEEFLETLKESFQNA